MYLALLSSAQTMAPAPAPYWPCLLRTILTLLILIISSPQALLKSAATDAVLEDGYFVSTALDGNKLSVPIHPFSILPRPQIDGKSPSLILLDSVNSVFYGLSLPLSQDGVITRVAGSGASGYSDGESQAAVFDHPRSFAIDAKGNAYVADRINNVIRKISTSGATTTIAGGYSRKVGNVDGPAQNASFSADFELVFIPQMCALLISDRGNNLIRYMNLKQEDCRYNSQPGGGLGATSVSLIVVLCSLISLVIGFIARPYLTTCEIYINHRLDKTWKRSETALETALMILCCVMKSAVANMTIVYIITYKAVSLIFSSFARNVNSASRSEKPVPRIREVSSLLDSDGLAHGIDSVNLQGSHDFTRQLADLISFDDGLILEPRSSVKDAGHNNKPSGDAVRIDEMIGSNLSDFVQKVNSVNANSGRLVKRHRVPSVF